MVLKTGIKMINKNIIGLVISVIGFTQLFCFTTFAQSKSEYVLDMVHNNPGEPLTQTVYNDPAYLKTQGFDGMVINDFTFVHAAITFDDFDKRILPEGSEARQWALNAADNIRKRINEAHAAGIKVYYFTDIIVLPKKLVELYKDEIVDANGKISFERPKTIEIHRMMLNEIFKAFPDIDGLVIRTGETYLNNVPFHTGNNPITNAAESHVKLLDILREIVCVKYNKMLFYRTWSFGGMHDNPDYYLDVTNRIEKHPNLIFSIKHTEGDYFRTFNFNPTLATGKHSQIVEVQCQREYEGKGAFPNYVANGVINGFEEYHTIKPQKKYQSINDIKHTPQFKGVWTWSRGGGWVGPYISNEFWIKLNTYVVSHWAQNTELKEEQIFNQFMDAIGIEGRSREAFRQLCVLSPKAVLRGHYSAVLPFKSRWVGWTRDEFLDGIAPMERKPDSSFIKEGKLRHAFTEWYCLGNLMKAVDERFEAVEMWKQIVKLSKQVKMNNKEDQQYISVSSCYGLYLHQIIAEGWNVMALGFTGDETGVYDKSKIKQSIKKYDKAWKQFNKLKAKNESSATLYKPYAWVYNPPTYHSTSGMGASVNKYRQIIK